MNKSLAIILGLLALVMGVGAIVALQDQGAPTTPAGASKLGQPLLPQLKAADIARITIREPKGSNDVGELIPVKRALGLKVIAVVPRQLPQSTMPLAD